MPAGFIFTFELYTCIKIFSKILFFEIFFYFSENFFLKFFSKIFFIFYCGRGGALPLDSPWGERWENENLSHCLKHYTNLNKFVYPYETRKD